MRISVLSGKGGTGKTMVSVNMAYAMNNCTYVDCDIEEPNGEIYLKPVQDLVEKVAVDVPAPLEERCAGCRECVEFCKYHALAYVKGKLMVFPELCHDCGGCIRLCRNGALMTAKRDIGKIIYGHRDGVRTRAGVLNVGEATGVPIIRRLIGELPEHGDIIADCPPGSSCTVMESILGSDYCILVAEPTVFGIHDMNAVYELAKLFSIPAGVVINKATDGNRDVEEFCSGKGIPVLWRIPFDREIGLLNSKGILLAGENERYLKIFKGLVLKVKEALKT